MGYAEGDAMTDRELLEAAEKDAARYRWLRSRANDWWDARIVRLYAGPDFDRLSGRDLDAAIDDAITAAAAPQSPPV